MADNVVRRVKNILDEPITIEWDKNGPSPQVIRFEPGEVKTLPGYLAYIASKRIAHRVISIEEQEDKKNYQNLASHARVALIRSDAKVLEVLKQVEIDVYGSAEDEDVNEITPEQAKVIRKTELEDMAFKDLLALAKKEYGYKHKIGNSGETIINFILEAEGR